MRARATTRKNRRPLPIIDETRRRDYAVVLRSGQQQIGERLQARLLGDLSLGAALRLERQINVTERPHSRLG
jgi:hypothetical protein